MLMSNAARPAPPTNGHFRRSWTSSKARSPHRNAPWSFPPHDVPCYGSRRGIRRCLCCVPASSSYPSYLFVRLCRGRTIRRRAGSNHSGLQLWLYAHADPACGGPRSHTQFRQSIRQRPRFHRTRLLCRCAHRLRSSAERRGGTEAAETKTVTLIPQAGTYQAHCSHFMHATMGMHTQVVVR